MNAAEGFILRLGEAIFNSNWLFPTFETLHFMGLCVLFGAILAMDLRLLGFVRRMPVAVALKFIPIALCGFSLSLISGFSLFITNPVDYWASVAFKVKMGLVVLGGLNAMWFEFAERRKVVLLPQDADTEFGTKLVAGLSLCLWVGVLMLGRLLPYLDFTAG